jgi:hypothetical protein
MNGRGAGVNITKESGVVIKAGASTAFFALVLLYTMSVFFFAFASGESFFGLYGALLGHPGGGGVLMGGMGIGRIILQLISLLPSILICAGLWLLCFSLRSKDSGSIRHLLLLKCAAALQFCLIFMLIAVVKAALFVNINIVTLQSYALADRIISGLSQPTVIIAFFALLAAAGALLAYALFIFKAIDMAVKTLRTGQRRGFVPMPLIILNSAFAAINLAGAGFDITRGNAAAAVAGICMAAFLLGMSAMLTVVRRGG